MMMSQEEQRRADLMARAKAWQEEIKWEELDEGDEEEEEDEPVIIPAVVEGTVEDRDVVEEMEEEKDMSGRKERETEGAEVGVKGEAKTGDEEEGGGGGGEGGGGGGGGEGGGGGTSDRGGGVEVAEDLRESKEMDEETRGGGLQLAIHV